MSSKLSTRKRTHGPVRVRCVGCRCHFETEDRDAEYCGEACEAEHQRTPEERPDSIEAFLTECYVEMDHNYHDTWKRARVVYGNLITKDQVRQTLIDLGVFHPRGALQRKLEAMDPDDIDWEAIRGAGDE